MLRDRAPEVVQGACGQHLSSLLLHGSANFLDPLRCQQRIEISIGRCATSAKTRTGHRQDRNPAAQQSLLRCAILSVGSTGGTGSETPRFHHASRERDGCAAVAWPLAAGAQQPTMPVIGYLSATGPNERLLAVFRQNLAEAGYIEGRNVASLTWRPQLRDCAAKADPERSSICRRYRGEVMQYDPLGPGCPHPAVSQRHRSAKRLLKTS
jgi:hypothetical protein